MHLLAALQGQASDVYTESLKELRTRRLLGHFEDQHLATLYHIQLKTRTQLVGEFLQEFVIAIEHLTHCALPAVPKDHVRREGGEVFVDGITGGSIKRQLLLGGERTVSEALRQALELEAVKLGDESPVTK
jgi:hypothetical protein